MARSDRGRPRSREELYDLYLDACLSGEAEAPDVFSERHDTSDPVLLERLEALYAQMGRSVRAAPGGEKRAGLPYERLGDYRLLRAIDSGGMGMVFEAVQESLDRPVALKIVRPELVSSRAARVRFEREARVLARLKHPNVITVHDFGEDEGVCYIAMDLLAGRTLDDLVREAGESGRTLDVTTLCGWFAALARGLHHAHREGVIHRDVKPANIHVGDDGVPRLLDFGIARDTDAGTSGLTQTFAGSPLYAAPEQIMGQAVDGRADVYALGISLYRALTGRVPFEGGTLEQVIRRALTDEPVAPRGLNPAMPRDLEVVILRAIEKEPGARYVDASALADDLEAVLDGRPIRARPPGPVARFRKWCRRRPVVAAVLALLIAGTAGFIAYRGAENRAAARERAEQGRAQVDRATALLADYASARERSETATRELGTIRDSTIVAWQPRATYERLESLEEAVEQAARDREASFWQALDALRRAEELGVDRERTAKVRSSLYAERVKDADARGDEAAEAFYRTLVERNDVPGDRARDATLPTPCRIGVIPEDAELFLFRYELQSAVVEGGAPRYVPVPLTRPEPPVPYGTVCLRVERGAGSIQRGDHILDVAGHPVDGTYLVADAKPPIQRLDRLVRFGDVDLPSPMAPPMDPPVPVVFERAGAEVTVEARGLAQLGVTLMTPAACAEQGGVRARVLQGERVHEVTLPTGLGVRPTGAPLLRLDAARLQTRELTLERGEYLLVARKRGFEEQRFPLRAMNADPLEITLRLNKEGTTPKGFVFVPAVAGADPFWVMEREVASREYLAFLRDPAVRAAIAKAPGPIYYPRDYSTRESGGYWGYAAEGEVEIPAKGWEPDWPVLGVSWDDAAAYAAWRTRRAQARGEEVEFALPTLLEWSTVAVGRFPWIYAHGNRFRAHWVHGARSHPQSFPEGPFRYPIDESPLGVFDCTGGVSEWLDDWTDRSRGLRRLAAGNWAYPDPKNFNIWGRGARPDVVSGIHGFRLVMRKR